MLLSDCDIREAMEKKEIVIENFSPECLQPASYDARLGKKGLICKTLKLEELEKGLKEEGKEINIEAEGSITIPAGAFALVTTLEKFTLSTSYAGHIGLRSYFARKGILLLSGLQIDPGFSGYLVLGLCNLSPRSFTIDYGDELCTVEFHKLHKPSTTGYKGRYAVLQKEERIPPEDKDYLRTIETMSVSDLTQALLTLSRNVNALRHNIWYLWIPVIITLLATIISAAIK
jgi:dCTP deaminase